MRKDVLFITILIIIGAGCLAVEKIPVEVLLPVRSFPAQAEERVYFKTMPVVAVDAGGNVYTLDNLANNIFKLSKEGKFIQQIGRKGQGPGDIHRPIDLKIDGDKLFVLDSLAISIFSLDGVFIRKFRLFNHRINFALLQDRVVVFEILKDNLFAMYAQDGKRLLTFGDKYRVDYGNFKGFEPSFVDKSIHAGKVLCDKDYIYFISEAFAEVFKYDARGKLINKVKLDGLDDDRVKKNIHYFFVQGEKNGGTTGTGLKGSMTYADAVCLPDEICILSTLLNYGKILAYDKTQFKLLREYRFDIMPEKKDELVGWAKMCAVSHDGGTDFYISCSGDDYFIGLYRLARRLN